IAAYADDSDPSEPLRSLISPRYLCIYTVADIYLQTSLSTSLRRNGHDRHRLAHDVPPDVRRSSVRVHRNRRAPLLHASDPTPAAPRTVDRPATARVVRGSCLPRRAHDRDADRRPVPRAADPTPPPAARTRGGAGPGDRPRPHGPPLHLSTTQRPTREFLNNRDPALARVSVKWKSHLL